MKKILLALLFSIMALPAAAQLEGEPAFTENEILILRAGRPLYQERLQKMQEMSDQDDYQTNLDAINTKITQITNLRDTWQAQGRTGAVTVANLVLDVLDSDKTALEDKLANPVDHTAKIQELAGILNDMLDVLETIAPEGRTRDSYLDYVR